MNCEGCNAKSADLQGSQSCIDARCKQPGTIIKAIAIAFSNDVGGTEFLEGEFRVRVESHHVDDEIGMVIHGHLIDQKDIEAARKKGTTGYGQADFKKYAGIGDMVAKARKAWDPTLVHVHSGEVA